MKKQHTPGPWTYEAEETGFAGAIVAKTGWICDFDTDPSPANARLIAAAPDLLEALIECEYIISHCLFGCDAENITAKARAAIAKTTGLLE
jgi:hypothetical protein